MAMGGIGPQSAGVEVQTSAPSASTLGDSLPPPTTTRQRRPAVVSPDASTEMAKRGAELQLSTSFAANG